MSFSFTVGTNDPYTFQQKTVSWDPSTEQFKLSSACIVTKQVAVFADQFFIRITPPKKADVDLGKTVITVMSGGGNYHVLRINPNDQIDDLKSFATKNEADAAAIKTAQSYYAVSLIQH